MSEPAQERPRGRETRLLFGTIAISVAVLLILARFRFPEERVSPPPEVQAPLERLAARATYDELAAIMADLERRLAPRLAVVPVQPPQGPVRHAVAPRLAADRAVLLMEPDERVAPGGPALLARVPAQPLAVLALPPSEEGPVTPSSGTPRPGPRYVASVEGSAQGPVIRPIYVGRTDILADPRTSETMLAIAAVQQVVPPGTALFTLAGNFIGLSTGDGNAGAVIPAETLRLAMERATPVTDARGDLGLDVQALTPGLARAAGAEWGVMVRHVTARVTGDIQPGDVLTSVDGVVIRSPADYLQAERSRAPGTEAVVSIVRRGKPLEARLAVADAAAAQDPDQPGDDPGLVLRAVPGLGAEVVAVRPGTRAAAAMLAAGDIIVAVEGRAAPAPAAVTSAWRALQPGSALLLRVERGGETRMAALEK